MLLSQLFPKSEIMSQQIRRKIRVVTRWFIKQRIKAKARNRKGAQDTSTERMSH